jgi:uracil-DNA glycosylase family 4
LADSRTTVVFGEGDAHAGLMVIGEGPGREEDLQGRPFVGRSGQLLDRLLLEEAGLRRQEVYIANVVKCRPPGNRDPRPDEIAACRPYLDQQIALIGPRVILTLGNFATRAMLGTSQGITRLRGRAWPLGPAPAAGPGPARPEPAAARRDRAAAPRAPAAAPPAGRIVVVPTFHPAAALRGGGEVVAQMRADIVRARGVLDNAAAAADPAGTASP